MFQGLNKAIRLLETLFRNPQMFSFSEEMTCLISDSIHSYCPKSMARHARDTHPQISSYFPTHCSDVTSLLTSKPGALSRIIFAPPPEKPCHINKNHKPLYLIHKFMAHDWLLLEPVYQYSLPNQTDCFLLLQTCFFS